jgi:hypothetical protein
MFKYFTLVEGGLKTPEKKPGKFLVVKGMNKLMRKKEIESKPAEKSEELKVLEEIRDNLKKG